MIKISNALAYLKDGAQCPAELLTEEKNGYSVISVAYKSGSPLGKTAVTLDIDSERPINRFMADYLYSSFWCRPAFGDRLRDVPNDTQGLLFIDESGLYTAVLPLSKGDFVSCINPHCDALRVYVRSYTESLTECSTPVLVAGEGRDPYKLLAELAAAAAEIIGDGMLTREKKKYPEVFEYLGWCSWDAMEIWVNEEEILQKCEEFKKKNIPVRWGIIDDMWADVKWSQKLPKFTSHDISFKVMHSSSMNNYTADPERFPNGLEGCIAKMKKQYDMKVGMWYPVTGYWLGITKGGELSGEASDCIEELKDGELYPTFGTKEKSKKYFDLFNDYFKRCGADFIKVDNQSTARWCKNPASSVGATAENMSYGIEKSVNEYFDGDIINCMGMATENMLGRRTTAISRCSNDFKPEDRPWFSEHLAQCAYNGLIQGQFYYNDWDMWWSDDGQALKNSVLRAISGGPVYVSDRLERSNAAIFKPLCFADGRILRPDNVAVPTEDCLFFDAKTENKPFKVFNNVGSSILVATYNVNEANIPVTGTLSPRDFSMQGESFLLYEYFSRTATLISADDVCTYTLEDNDSFRLFSVIPIEDGRAYIGNCDKFVSVKGITSIGENRFSVYEDGVYKLYSEKKISEFTNENGETLDFAVSGNVYTVKVSGKEVRFD